MEEKNESIRQLQKVDKGGENGVFHGSNRGYFLVIKMEDLGLENSEK